MKQATLIGITISTVFYMLCGVLGYAAFGNNAPGNFLTGFGFYEPFWLVAFANLCIVIHLIGAYQVFCQPLFMFVENWSRQKWKGNKLINAERSVVIPFFGVFELSLFRLFWRTIYVICTTILAMLFPFFNNIVGLIGAAAFWPLTVYFPTEMYIARSKMPSFSLRWIMLRTLTSVCLVISLLAVAGSVQGLVKSVTKFKPFHSVS
ncbi:arginine/alanine aminopeptidase [Castilleja foliolosa]|uniref:Arginine/alanine aminopeptidase n=1 Tax=Castilleja foliolosa TaxID=1961234 RepID=A0ABD3DCI8_9LAMI